MNWDRIEGNWKQFKGKIHQQWGKLTDDDLDMIDGRREELAGKIQEAYGVSKDEAEQADRALLGHARRGYERHRLRRWHQARHEADAGQLILPQRGQSPLKVTVPSSSGKNP